MMNRELVQDAVAPPTLMASCGFTAESNGMQKRALKVAVFCLTTMLAAGLSGALAADLPIKLRRPAPLTDKVPRDNVFAPPSPTCKSWTDGCRTCQGAPNAVSCSNVGIACIPKNVTCLDK